MNRQFLQDFAHNIRVLSGDAIEAAQSGHPGLPFGCAEIGASIWGELLHHNPANPAWVNRDRFVLSAGHGSMLLYSLLHLCGYSLSLEEIKQFRQINSRATGHPEYWHVPGIETTTGPLGQGFANAVGMAMGETIAAQKYNTDTHHIIDHYVYVLAGDGCMMEGITSEAASLAGHLQLGKLIVLYDSNSISIEGSTNIAFTESVAQRFAAYNWDIHTIDGHDISAIQEAVLQSKVISDKPSLIICKTTIGYMAPKKAGTAKAHGEPLGHEEIAQFKQNLGINPHEQFQIFESVQTELHRCRIQWQKNEEQWNLLFQQWALANPTLKKLWDTDHDSNYAWNVVRNLDFSDIIDKKLATRASSGAVLQILAQSLPNLIGGSADLAPSNNSELKEYAFYSAYERSGRNIHFGVREHAMGAIGNGLVLYGGLQVFVATFLIFVDYMRHTVRLAAFMKIPIKYILTHDSFYVGEDGPTHHPVEHISSLRLIPNLLVWRPADAHETAEAWRLSFAYTTMPSAFILTRQALSPLQKPQQWRDDFAKGAYIIHECENPTIVLLATGSEVHLALKAVTITQSAIQVVSVSSLLLLQQQDASFLWKIVPPTTQHVISVEAGMPWAQNLFMMKHFGICDYTASGTAAELEEKFHFTAQDLVAYIENL